MTRECERCEDSYLITEFPARADGRFICRFCIEEQREKDEIQKEILMEAQRTMREEERRISLG